MISNRPQGDALKAEQGAQRLYVGSLHLDVTEEMLRGIFEPFGKIQSIQLMHNQVSTVKNYIFF
jgi:RNA recognition motif-containing protein